MPGARQSAKFAAIDWGRLIVALAILAAVIGQLAVSIGFWTNRGDERIGLDILNFFSFFTIESNLLAMVVLLAQAIGRARGRAGGRALHVAVLCATTYMVITGIVYNTVLRSIELPQGTTLGWSNEMLHLIAPLWMLIDWLLTARTRELRFAHIGVVVIYPVVWLAYTLMRGPATLNQGTGAGQWYPYPFLDPAHAGGYGAVAVACVLVAVAIVAVALGLVAVSRWARRRS
ncbi:Pr6Pr family membrane protein [Leucobacter sp. GX0328]